MSAPTELTEEQTARLWLVFLSGVATGTATLMIQQAPEEEALAQATGKALARIVSDDPIVRDQLLERMTRLYLTGEAAEEFTHHTAYVMGHDHPHD